MKTKSRHTPARRADSNGKTIEKPKYKVPSMKEIEAIPWNGFNVVSTFSGGGGSCLGYRMAGYRVLWANEFVEEAQKTYRLNHPGVHLCCDDIHDVTPEQILKDINMEPGEIDLFDGSPPCCAFSTCGSRDDGWGNLRKYSDGKLQRTDNLFEEYIRILNGLQPKTFVAENVSGLVKGDAFGYFKIFIQEMKDCGYNVKASVLNAKWLGVPQSRERVIFVGVRKDLHMNPVFPKPLPYQYTLGDALENLENDKEQAEFLRQNAQKYAWRKVAEKMPKNPKKPLDGADYANGSYFNLKRESLYEPCSTICQSHGGLSVAGSVHPLEDRKFTIPELKRIVSIPDDFVCTGDYSQQWERLGRMVPPVMMYRISKTIAEEILCKTK